MSPEISVVVPTFNRAAVLHDCVASVLAQDGVDLECIVVDDGSSDGTTDVLRELAEGDARVVVAERPNGGPSAARNSGIARARGSLVTFHDSDDLMPPGRLARQCQLRRELAVDGVLGRYECQTTPDGPVPEWLQRRPDWRSGWSWTSVMLPRIALDAIGGFDEELRLAEDLDLVVRVRAAGFQVATVDEVFVQRRLLGDNLTWELHRSDPGLATVVRRHLRAQRRT